MLIYNNVETLAEVEKYLLKEPAVWGKGQVIITSRNTQLLNTLGAIITLDNLNSDETLTLFGSDQGKLDLKKTLDRAETVFGVDSPHVTPD